jgi:hypothetical protein
MLPEFLTLPTILIVLVSLASVISCLYVLALRLERDRAITSLVTKAKQLQERQDNRLRALREGVPFEELPDADAVDGFDVEIVESDEAIAA